MCVFFLGGILCNLSLCKYNSWGTLKIFVKANKWKRKLMSNKINLQLKYASQLINKLLNTHESGTE